jgi:hypothetical protein
MTVDIGRKADVTRAVMQYLGLTHIEFMPARIIRTRKEMKSKMNERSCYSCIYCTSELHEYAVWCSETGKTIDDGFGEGDCNTCSRFIPCRSLVYSSDSEPLPF